MWRKSAKKKSYNLKDILDSDDELPNAHRLITLSQIDAHQTVECRLLNILWTMLSAEYIDLPFVPAYLVDNRFENIEEKKVDKGINKHRKEQPERHLKGGLRNAATVIACGYLNKKDTFCFQCLEPMTGKKTQEWFLKFLMIKDLHASYTFLTTCLVPSYSNDYSSGDRKSFKDCNEKIWKYKMVASK